MKLGQSIRELWRTMQRWREQVERTRSVNESTQFESSMKRGDAWIGSAHRSVPLANGE